MSDGTYGNLLEMWQQLKERDPLFKNGVGLDWVCVLNPALVSVCMEAASGVSVPRTDEPQHVYLRRMLGRTIYIESRAPRDEIEFMTLEMYYKLYPQQPPLEWDSPDGK